MKYIFINVLNLTEKKNRWIIFPVSQFLHIIIGSRLQRFLLIEWRNNVNL